MGVGVRTGYYQSTGGRLFVRHQCFKIRHHLYTHHYHHHTPFSSLLSTFICPCSSNTWRGRLTTEGGLAHQKRYTLNSWRRKSGPKRSATSASKTRPTKSAQTSDAEINQSLSRGLNSYSLELTAPLDMRYAAKTNGKLKYHWPTAVGANNVDVPNIFVFNNNGDLPVLSAYQTCSGMEAKHG